MATAADLGPNRRGGGWRDLARGAVVGLCLSAAVLIGLSLTQPLPDYLPGIGGPTLEPTLPGTPPAAPDGAAHPAPAGATLTPAPEGATLTPAPAGATLTPAPAGATLTPAPEGANLTPAPEGANLTPAPAGADLTAAPRDASPGAGPGATAGAPAAPEPGSGLGGAAAPAPTDPAVDPLPDPAALARGLAATAPSDGSAPVPDGAAPPADLAIDVPLPPRSETAPVLSDTARAALAAIGGPARQRNAATYQTEGSLPLIAVILDDASGAALPIEALLALEMPITLGIVPGRGADTALARAAHSAGVEVLAQLPLGSVEAQGLLPGMAPEEITTRVATMLARLNLAAAAAPFGPVGGESANLVARLKAEQARWGFADPTGPDGRLTAEVTIPAGITTDQGYRLLDTAAREAQARGTAIVRAATSRPMLEALLLWGLERGGRAARIAPLSAVLARRAAG